MKTSDKAYTSNYPLLEEWLQKHEARCDWQLLHGKQDSETAYEYVERWSIGARHFLIVVRSHGRGWDIYTECGSHFVGDTFADAETRLGIKFP